MWCSQENGGEVAHDRATQVARGCEAGLVVENEDSNQHRDAEEDEQENYEVAEVVAA